MRNEELKEFVLRVLHSRSRGEGHLAKGSLDGLSVRSLVDHAASLFKEEPVVLTLTGSYIVVGDLHGSIDDLLQVFNTFDYPPMRSYLFLGDYVDRGCNSIEVLTVLYALKCLFPHHVYLLRGNHECESVTRVYGFKAECQLFFKKRRTYYRFCESFSHMPISAVVNSKIFCVHGGLSPNIDCVADLRVQIQKPVADVSTSVAEHLLWSDPSADVAEFEVSPRRRGFLFGSEAVDQFLRESDLAFIVRAHQYCEFGSKLTFEGCLTIFSASDYCGRGNEAAVVLLGDDCSIRVEQIPKINRMEGVQRQILPQWLIDTSVARQPELYEPLDFLRIAIEDIRPAQLVCG
jgi:diadenosine tetraphosphatase ApaH/serine/threonine PP2A family protein phosphatase